MSDHDTSDQWRRITTVFHGAMEQDNAHLSAYLAEQCGEDKALRREVEDLLAAEGRRRDAFGDDAAAFVVPLQQEPRLIGDTHEAGDTIGHYRLVEPIGSGGMGSVWRAERTDGGFDQEVAVKLIKPGMDSHEILTRFRRERQVLAGLEHPNIARLLDGGATDEGRPYLVMEHVDGVAMDRYCDEHRLGLDDRLHLFRKVCAAVQRAHQNLVVHRDLKPGNILVTDEGEPKLLDFGIAKVLSTDTQVAVTASTVPGCRPMTPKYASPEQARGESITTSSDVYSLGVVLYELITGHPPYRMDGGRAADFAQVICEEEPTRPSAAILQSLTRTDDDGTERTLTPAEVSAARGTEPGRLRRRLAGDLDTILLTCLRKEPERRYSSAQELSEDLRRYLLSLPVAARPDTLGYRTHKFIRRNVVPTAAAAVVLAALLCATAFSTAAAISERTHRRVADAVNEFLNEEVLAGANLIHEPNPGITMREVLDNASDRIEEFDESALVEASIRRTIGNAYDELAMHDEATHHLERTLAIVRRELGSRDPLTLQAMGELADVYTEVGRLDEAAALVDEGLRIARATLDPHDGATIGLVQLSGALHALNGRFEEAQTMMAEALALQTEALGERHPKTTGAMSMLGHVCLDRGEYEEGKRLLSTVVEILMEHRGPDNPRTLIARHNLARAYDLQDRLDLAEPIYQEVLVTTRQKLGDDDPRTANRINSLALLWMKQGRLAEAEPLFREAMEINRRRLGDEHVNTVNSMANLGLICGNLGKLEESETLQVEVLRLRRETQGDEHPRTAHAMNNLGELYFRLGRLDEAEPLLSGALTLRIETLGRGHPETLVTMNGLANVYRRQGRLDDALPLISEAVESTRAALGPRHEQTIALTGTLATVLAATGDLEGAERHFASALERLRETKPAGFFGIGALLGGYGGVLQRQDRLDEAEAALLEAHQIFAGGLPSRHPRMLRLIAQIVELYEAMDNPHEAEQWRARLPE